MCHARLHRLVLMLLLLCGPLTSQAATFTVEILADDADAEDVNPGDGACLDNFNSCTLRAAIMEANALAGDDAIEFSVSGTVTLFSGLGPLPAITEFIIIDGTTAPGFNLAGQTLAGAPPAVTLDGRALSSSNHNGLTFSGAAASDSQVFSLGIRNFPGDGISAITGTDGLFIQGCVIDGNADAGMFLFNPDAMVIGRFYNFFTDQFQGLGNQITNNGGNGITLAASDNNLVFGNYVGMEADGTTDGGNGGDGVVVIGSGSLIGFYDDDERAGNIVSNNSGHGISVTGGGNSLFANRVGTGSVVGFFGNGGEGIRVTGSDNVIGNDAANAANTVINNTLGIRAGTTSSSANGAQIVGNRIGVVEGLGNLGDGIRVENATGVVIRGNQIVNNGAAGIHALPDVPGVVIQGNEVGVVGGLRRGNTGDGIWARGPGAVIGGDDATEGNVIGDNGGSGIPPSHGIRLSGDGGQIIGNYIGTTPTAVDVGQPATGIALQSNVSTVARNVIGFNAIGISVAGNSHTIEENWIGTNTSGSRMGQTLDGIYLTGASTGVSSFIGPRNVIAFSDRFGIRGETDLGVATEYNIIGNQILNNGNSGFFGPLDAGAGFYTFSFNEFAYNGNGGIRAFNSGTRARLIVNYFFGNTGLGFDLGASGPNPIDTGDPDEGPNRGLNAPEILDVSFFFDGMNVPMISADYRVDTSAANATYPLTVYAFWSERVDDNQGRYFITSVEYATRQAVQNTVFDLSAPAVPEMLATGGSLILMVNDADGNSSEYSSPFEFGLNELFFRDGFETLVTRFD